MKYTVEEVSPVLRKVNIEIPSDDVKDVRDKVLQKTRRSAKFKGFRPGRAPLPMVESSYGRQIDMDSVEKIMEKFYPQILEQSGLKPVSSPTVNFDSFDLQKDFAFSVEFEINPVFDLDPAVYRGLRLKEPDYKVTDEIMEKAELKVREAWAETVDVEKNRPIAEKDILLVNYQNFDGDKVIEAKHTEVTLDMAAEELLPELRAALVGRQVGETVEASVAFGENTRDEFKNRTIKFVIEPQKIREKRLPDLDEEFIRRVSPSTSLEQFKDNMRRNLLDRFENQKNEALRRQIIAQLNQAVELELPPSLVSAEQERMVKRILEYMQNEGINPSDANMDTKAMLADVEADARGKVKAALILSHIANKEGISVGPADIDRKISSLVNAGMGRSAAEMKRELSKNGYIDRIASGLLEEKLLRFLKEAAVIAKIEPEEFEAESARPAAAGSPGAEI
jgi:trigger factor